MKIVLMFSLVAMCLGALVACQTTYRPDGTREVRTDIVAIQTSLALAENALDRWMEYQDRIEERDRAQWEEERARREATVKYWADLFIQLTDNSTSAQE